MKFRETKDISDQNERSQTPEFFIPGKGSNRYWGRPSKSNFFFYFPEVVYKLLIYPRVVS